MLKNNLIYLTLIFLLVFKINTLPDKDNAIELSNEDIKCYQGYKTLTYKVMEQSKKIFRISKIDRTNIEFYEEDSLKQPYSQTSYNIIYQKYSSNQLYLVVKFSVSCFSIMFIDSVDEIYLPENKILNLPFASSSDKFCNIKIKDSNLNQNMIEIKINGPYRFSNGLLEIYDNEMTSFKGNRELIKYYYPQSNEIFLCIQFTFDIIVTGIVNLEYKQIKTSLISENFKICTKNPIIGLYYLNYNSNNPYYDVSFNNDNNFYNNSIKQTGKIFKGKMDSSSQLLVNFSSGGCLQILFFQNENILLKKNLLFSFQIFQTREFIFEINDNEMKDNRVNIILTSDFFEIDKVLIDNKIQKYFISNNERTKFIYHYYSNTQNFQLNPSFFYKENNNGYNEINIKYEIAKYEELYENTFKCYNLGDYEFKIFKIKYNSNKEYIDLSVKGQLIIYNGKEEEFYQNKDIFNLEKNKELIFRIFKNRNINFELNDTTIINNLVNIIFYSSNPIEINSIKIEDKIKNYFISNKNKTKITYHYISQSSYKENNNGYNEISVKYEIAKYEEITDDIINKCYNLGDGEFKIFKIKYNSNKEYIDLSLNKKQLIFYNKKEQLENELAYYKLKKDENIYVELSGNVPCINLNYLQNNSIILSENKQETLIIYQNRNVYLTIKGEISDEIELIFKVDNKKSTIDIERFSIIGSPISSLNKEVLDKNNQYKFTFNLNVKEAKIGVLITNDSKLTINIFYKKIKHWFISQIAFPLFFLGITLICLACHCYNRINDAKKEKLLKEKKMKEEEEKKKEDEILKKKINNFYTLIKKNPEDLNKICPICFKDKREDNLFMDMEPIFTNKNEYINEIRDTFNGPNFDGVISFLKNIDCPHFFHNDCKAKFKKNFECYLCNSFVHSRNLIVFLEIDEKSFSSVLKNFHGKKYSFSYKKKVVEAVYKFIEEDKKIDENVKREIKLRRNLALKFINVLDYSEFFEIKLHENIEEYEDKFEKIKQKRKERELEMQEYIEENKYHQNNNNGNQKKIDNEQNKKIKLKVCGRCYNTCVACKRKINKAGSRAAYAHKKCYNSNYCVICGSKMALHDASFNICIDCYKNSFGKSVKYSNCFYCNGHFK